jgi:hypothetical protein
MGPSGHRVEAPNDREEPSRKKGEAIAAEALAFIAFSMMPKLLEVSH